VKHIEMDISPAAAKAEAGRVLGCGGLQRANATELMLQMNALRNNRWCESGYLSEHVCVGKLDRNMHGHVRVGYRLHSDPPV